MEKHGALLQEKKQEAMRYNEERNQKLDRLVETWLRTEYGEGLDKIYSKSKNKARNTAVALEMQEQYMNTKWSKLQEAIASTGFDTTPEFLLRVVRLGVANSFRGDIFNDISLTSTDDAIYTVDFTYEQALRGATAGDKLYENVNKYYAGSTYTESIGTGDGGTKNYTGSVSKTPLYPFHNRVMVGGVYMGVDDGNGNFVGPGIDSSSDNTINYTSGAVVLNLSANAPSGADVVIEYTFSMEDADNYDQLGTVGINVRKNRFAAKPVPLGYEFYDMAAITLESTGLGNMHDYLLQGVADEHARARDYRAIAFGRQIAKRNSTYEFNADWAGEGSVDPYIHAQSLLPFIGRINAEVYDETTRGELNTAVFGSKALTLAKQHKLWRTDEQGYKQGVYQAGYLDNIKVFTCPANDNILKTDQALFTFRNPTDDSATDLSIIYGTLTEISAELRYPEMRTKGTLASVEDKIVYNDKYARLVDFKNL